jgi:hypothetical protein
MESLAAALLELLEILVLGALTVCTVAYAIVLIHPAKNAVREYMRSIHGLLVGGTRDSKLRTLILSAAVLGIVYYLGVVTNVASSWLVKPAHLDIVHRTERTARVLDGERNRETDGFNEERSLARLLSRPIPGFREIDLESHAVYSTHVRLQQEWRNRDLPAFQDALSGLLKQIRLLRGSAILSLAWAAIAALKVAVALLVIVLLAIGAFAGSQSGPWAKILRWLHSTFVQETASEELGRHGDRMRIARDRMLGPNLVYLVLSAVLYLITMLGYEVAEEDYHLAVHHGVASALQTSAAPG